MHYASALGLWGSRGGAQGGSRGRTSQFFSNFLPFNIERSEVVEYAAAIIFHPPPGGDPPLLCVGGVRQV